MNSYVESAFTDNFIPNMLIGEVIRLNSNSEELFKIISFHGNGNQLEFVLEDFSSELKRTNAYFFKDFMYEVLDEQSYEKYITFDEYKARCVNMLKDGFAAKNYHELSESIRLYIALKQAENYSYVTLEYDSLDSSNAGYISRFITNRMGLDYIHEFTEYTDTRDPKECKTKTTFKIFLK